jgi:hypothetical protein
MCDGGVISMILPVAFVLTIHEHQASLTSKRSRLRLPSASTPYASDATTCAVVIQTIGIEYARKSVIQQTKMVCCEMRSLVEGLLITRGGRWHLPCVEWASPVWWPLLVVGAADICFSGCIAQHSIFLRALRPKHRPRIYVT